MEQDDGRGLSFQGVFKHLSRVDHGLVDDALLDGFLIDDAVLRIQEDHAELLVLEPSQGGLAVVHQLACAGDLGFLAGLLPEIARAEVLDQLHQCGGMGPDADDLFEIGPVRVEDAPNAAEGLEERPGARFDIPLGDGIAQHQLDGLVVVERFQTRPAVLRFQAIPVPLVVRGVFRTAPFIRWNGHPADLRPGSGSRSPS